MDIYWLTLIVLILSMVALYAVIGWFAWQNHLGNKRLEKILEQTIGLEASR